MVEVLRNQFCNMQVIFHWTVCIKVSFDVSTVSIEGWLFGLDISGEPNFKKENSNLTSRQCDSVGGQIVKEHQLRYSFTINIPHILFYFYKLYMLYMSQY